MKITIEYESSWRNSFLDGSNNEELPKGGRNFIGSIKTLNDKTRNNYITRTITKDTIMGILNRLIGDQRKLYQARLCDNYYFADIEETIQDLDFVDKPSISDEMVYIRNVTGSTDQNSFTGMIKANDPAFKSEFSAELWGILWLNLEQVLDFILASDLKVSCQVSLDPIAVCNQIEQLSAEKPLNVIDKVEKAIKILQDIYPDINYLTAKGQLPLVSLYTSALYLQIDRLKQHYDLSMSLTKSGGLSGISKRGFTKKDFMGRFTTGEKKIVWGNPYIKKDFLDGEGKINKLLTKANGVLEINLNISEERAKDLEQKILDAGVSSFYLGKKGLAYVTKIDTRENS